MLVNTNTIRQNNKKLKIDLATELLCIIGFKHLDDKQTIILKEDLSTTFKGYLRKRLKRPVRNASDVIKVVRMVVKNDAIRKGIYIKKHNFPKGHKKGSFYSYRLLHLY